FEGTTLASRNVTVTTANSVTAEVRSRRPNQCSMRRPLLSPAGSLRFLRLLLDRVEEGHERVVDVRRPGHGQRLRLEQDELRVVEERPRRLVVEDLQRLR